MRVLSFGVLVLGAAMSGNALAQKAYKHVDEKGNVTYSQTPPTEAKKVQQVDISPAQAGRGGHPMPGSRDIQIQRSRSYQDERTRSYEAFQQQQKEAEQKRLAALKAECTRNRGADCDNPQTLQDMEAQRRPGGSRINPAYRY
jgi:hypothetical protein